MTEHIKEHWQTIFLNAGTEKGLGDLSMMIGVVSSVICKAIQEECGRLVDEIEELEIKRYRGFKLEPEEIGYNQGLQSAIRRISKPNT